MEFIGSKPVLHQSTITSLLNCGEQYRLGDIVRKRPDLQPYKGLALHYGTAFHSAIESYFRAQLDEYEISVEDIVAGLRRTWLIPKDGIPVRWDGQPEESLGSCEKLVRRYLDWYSNQPPIKPALIEQNIRIETEYAWLEGTLDLVLDNGTIWDWKTAGTYESFRDVADKGIQSWFYPLLRSGVDIQVAKDIPFVYHGAIKSTYQIYTSLKYAKKEDLEILLYRMIPNAAKLISQNGPFIPNPLFIWCRSNMCSVWDMCRGGKIKIE